MLWLDAERAWAVADFRTAATSFDAAIRATSYHHRAMAPSGDRRASPHAFTWRTSLDHGALALLEEAEAYTRIGVAPPRSPVLDQRYPVLRTMSAGPVPTRPCPTATARSLPRNSTFSEFSRLPSAQQ